MHAAALWLIHLNAHRLRIILSVIAVGVIVWFCLPASLRTKLWEGWKKFGHAIGNFQARVLLTIIYSVLILPFGLAGSLLFRFPAYQEAPREWFDHPPMPNTLNEARRQG